MYKLNLYRFAILIIVCDITFALKREPRIFTRNGHLAISVDYNKNINLLVSGEGKVKINNEDIVKLINSVKNVSNLIDSFTKPIPTIPNGNQIFPFSPNFVQRIDILEQNFNNYTSTTKGVLIRIKRRLNIMQRNLRNIMVSLSTNECDKNPCLNGGTCQDLYKSFSCTCPKGWEGPVCDKDVNECAIFAGTDLGCQNGATCTNKPGTYECVCPVGFFGTHCTTKTIDCYTSGKDLCGHGSCVPQATGYKCFCDQGWTTDGKNPACTVDVDECDSNRLPCSTNPMVQCINVPGSFYCGHCPQGYTGNGYYCNDIDECQVFNGGCSVNPMVQCINTPGSRMCGLCPPGYLGNGVTCSYQGSVCNVNNGGCNPLAQCRDNPRISSSYVECICPRGYSGNGVGPSGCIQSNTIADPCASNPCVYGSCSLSNTTGDYVCFCRRRYTGRNCDIRKNTCLSNPCLNGGTCVDVLGISYRCQCTSQYVGNNCQMEKQSCGGKLDGYDGVLQFPADQTEQYKHSLSCAWVIQTNSTKVLNITFTKFDLEDSSECQYDWLQIHDGRNSAAHMIGRFCGSKLPKGGNIVTTTNLVYIWFRSDTRHAKDGFSFNWTTIDPECGGTIVGKPYGTIQSPGYPGNYPSNRDCYWTIVVEKSKRLDFHFFTVTLGNDTNCTGDYLEFYSLAFIRENRFAQYCSSSLPAPMTSPSSKVIIYFHSDSIASQGAFQISYKTVSGIPNCGGVFMDTRGQIVNPVVFNYDSFECEYLIRVKNSFRVKVEFTTLDISRLDLTCARQFIKIYDGPTIESPQVGKYCDGKIPAPYLSTTNQVLIVYKGVGTGTFKIKYESVCGRKYTTETGEIYSSNYPYTERMYIDCIYEIELTPGKSIILNIVKYRVPLYPNSNSGIEVRDGNNKDAPLLLSGNSSVNLPLNVASTHNHMWIKFQSTWITQDRSYYMNYTSLDVGCGGIFTKNLGMIQSPSHPNVYPSDMSCKWVIQAPLNYVIQLSFLNFKLEQSLFCRYDYVSIYDLNDDMENHGFIGKFCGSKVPPTLLSSSNMLKVEFKSDNSHSRQGFLASYIFVSEENVCGGTYFTNTGIIKSPRYPKPYPVNKDCKWIIHVQPGRQIMLNITDFYLESYSNCRYDFLEIRNGGTAASPLIGKYCGTTIPKVIYSHANQLYIYFKTDMSRSNKGFMIYWSSASTGCGGTLTSPKGAIISPHYPEPYNRNTECYWRISINAGSVIQIVFADLELEPHLTCSLDYVEVFDGKDMSANSLGRFCSTHPPYIRSTSNHMVIKFRSDVSFQGRGFQIQYSTVCQNTLTGFSGVIESPNFPNRYPQNVDCTWIVGVTEGNKINMTFSHFELERSLSYGDVKCNFDYVEFIYTDHDEEHEVKQTFCGVAIPPPITINSNNTQIHFVSDHLLMGNGFRLEWVIVGCGGVLTHPTGRFSSPNYPGHYPSSTRCDWIIEVPYGNSIAVSFKELDIEHNTLCVYDFIEIYNGRDDKAPLMTQICHTNKPVTITSSGHNVLVRFESDSSFEGQGFEGTYETVPSKCGGVLKVSSGTLTSPNYPKNYDRGNVCEWLIEIEEIHVIELTFTDFDLARDANRTYVKVYDGPTSAYPVLAYLLGDEIHNGTIRSSHNHMFVEFVTTNVSMITAKGFKASYTTACGAILNSETSGMINYKPIQRLYADSCQWTIIAPDPSQHVYLTFSHLTGYFCNFNMNQVIVYNGFNSSAPKIGEYCEQLPHMITSAGSVLHIDANMGFKATYSTLSTICGGSLEDTSGYFATPNYPDNYPVNTQCEWILNISQCMTTTITFSTFDILESEHCNDDFVEIRENDSGGKLLGVFCGKNVPTNIVVIGQIWIMFNSNQPDTGGVVTTGKGFMAEYQLMQHTDFYEPSGTITSPLYPEYYMKSSTFTWRITVKFGYKIAIKMLDLSLDYVEDYCFTNYLAFYDGYDTQGSQLRKFCGIITESFKTSSNMVYVKLVSDNPRRGVKFSFEWLQVEDTKNETDNTKMTDNCGNKEVIDINPLRNYTLRSPGYPNGYASSLKCEWIFSTIPENHLQLDFYKVDLEYRVPCLFDKIEVYSGKGGIEDWQLLATVCLPNDTYRDTIETTNLMKVVFISDYYLNQTGFSAMVTDACGGSVEKRNGIITVDNTTFTNMYALECQWNISVRTGRTMNVNFLTFDIGDNKDSRCRNYILLKNGQTADSPILGKGKYCGEVSPTNFQTSSNHLYVKFSTMTKVRGFSMEYSEVSVDCDASISLTYEDNTKYISSPNYPNIPLPHTECQWIISTAPGESIQMDFVERFDLTYTPDCYKEYVEIRNGGTIISPLIGRYCESMPNTLVTNDNIAFVKFFTDVEDPRNGFKIRLTIAKCGGTIRDSTGTIQSRYFNNKKLFPKNENCTWEIEGPEGHFIIINFETLDLPNFLDNCTASYVEIFEHSIRDYDELTSIGKYCTKNKPEVKALSNKVMIRFVTGPRNILAAGFSLNFTATKEKCGGKLTADSGYITSPRYPFMFPTKCEWIIEVTKGRMVQVELVDLDFDTSQPSQGLAFSNAESFAGHITVIKAGDTTKIVNSTDNIMYIFYWAIYTSNHRGFKLRYSSDEPTVCLGNFSLPNGTINSPRDITFYYCSWKRVEHDRSQRTLVLKIDIQNATALTGVATPSRCKYTRTYLLITAGNEDMELGQICTMLGKPEIIRIPYPVTEIIANKVGRSPIFDFAVDYKTYQCGGIIRDEYGNITSPGFPKRTSETVDCAWLIELPEDQTIRLKFEALDLGDDCEKSFVIIYNGKLNTSPRIGKYCKSTFPQTIQSQSNHLWIDYHSETSAGKGFNVTYEAQSTGCGGIYHSTRLIQTPSYPDNYPNNAECVWEVRGAAGYHIGLEFIGRFQMEKTDGCKNDFLQVWDYRNDDWLSLGRWCGRESPKFLNSSSTQMKIMFRSNEDKSGTGFKAKWVLNCGGNFTATPSLQYITSPGYPDKYDDDLNCVYNISAPGKYILVKFDDFNLEIGNPNCPYDSVTISYTVYGIVKTQSYCGFNKPPDLNVKNKISITFKTDMFVKKTGFKFYFTTDSCGEDITSPTEISSPQYVVNSFYAHSRLYKCYWNITAPKDKVVAVKFHRISTQDSRYCWYNYLALYNTFNTSLENRLAKFCGNLTYNVPIIRSTDNKMLLEYRSYNNKNNFFKASVYFTYGPKSGCGGAITMDVNDKKYIEEPNLRGQLDCQWVVQAPEGYHVNFEVTTIPSCQLSKINATNHLEIRNGASHFSELLTDLCDPQKSLRKLSTSLPQAFVQWSTLDSKGNANGFAITLSISESKCGQIYLMANETTQYITSPNYPEKYPDNIKCVWKINSTTAYKHLILKLIDFDLGQKDGSTECTGDRLEIVDKENRRVIDEGLGSQAIYYFGRVGPVYKGLRRPIGVHQYCGQTGTEFDYYSGEGSVIVSLHSGGGEHGKGFKLGYSLVGGCRNYTSAQGRLYNNNVTDCGFTITTPENTTISLYFMRFVGFFKAHTTECGAPKMEIYDGDSDKATKLATHCSFTLPDPVFSTANNLFIKISRGKYSFAYYDITYTSTSEGRGCGGKIFNYKGTFTSPLYPNNYRKLSYCRWEITVPYGLRISLKFTVFDIRASCDTDYIKISLYNDDENIQRFCPDDTLPVFEATYKIVVEYWTSLQNGGTGWVAHFAGFTDDQTIQW